ncbi:hypothetical protein B0H10DRAFT_2003974 [Mycena sp. CBHHK59/15]|nr:hypothetical protein B0H10DRAFT_2003974 [Mycena sp. CBHHK59/15]
MPLANTVKHSLALNSRKPKRPTTTPLRIIKKGSRSGKANQIPQSLFRIFCNDSDSTGGASLQTNLLGHK